MARSRKAIIECMLKLYSGRGTWITGALAYIKKYGRGAGKPSYCLLGAIAHCTGVDDSSLTDRGSIPIPSPEQARVIKLLAEVIFENNPNYGEGRVASDLNPIQAQNLVITFNDDQTNKQPIIRLLNKALNQLSGGHQ